MSRRSTRLDEARRDTSFSAAGRTGKQKDALLEGGARRFKL